MSTIARTCQAAREAFREQGAVVLRNVFDKQWLRQVATGITRNMESPSQFSETMKAEEAPNLHFGDYCNWFRIPEFKDFINNSPAAEIAGRLMDSKYSVFYHDFVVVKEGGDQECAPWHHNQSYYPIDGIQNCSIWMPLDSVTSDNSLRFVSGSHLWDKWFYPRRFAKTHDFPKDTRYRGDRAFEDVPDIDGAEPGKYEILNFDVEPGDCIVFHMKTLHSSPPNTSKSTRRVLSTRWLGEDAVLTRRPWTVSPPILGGLKPGMTVKTEIFPMLWKKSPKE